MEFKTLGLVDYDKAKSGDVQFWIEVLLESTTNENVSYPIYQCPRSKLAPNVSKLETSLWINNDTFLECEQDDVIAFELEYYSYFVTYEMKIEIESDISASEWSNDYRSQLQEAASVAFQETSLKLTDEDCSAGDATCQFFVAAE